MTVAGLACSSNLFACGARTPHRKFRDFDRAVYPEIFRMILDHGVSPNLVGRFRVSPCPSHGGVRRCVGRGDYD